tara:strand:+ start:81 stop:488 length:408 start_codon:yes stop_codon:yes gene_type:complete
MPNWCNNRVYFGFGNVEDNKAFRDWIGIPEDEDDIFNTDGEFDFERISPIPKDDIDNDGWRNWCITNWGTKWNAQNVYIHMNEPDGIEITFDTAWAPATGIFELIEQKIAEEEWDITVSWFYDEPGMQVAGYLPN